LINTSLLYQHFVNEGFANIARNGLAFEPAFPMSTYFRETEHKSDRRAFFFYARPDNVRNLFLLGLEAVKESVVRGVLDRHWDVHFVGSRIPPLKLPHGLIPRRSENLPWPKYAALLRRVDVGLSLVSTPHPSYPPLDLAACGAVAVTNRFGLKQSLNSYSRNIICADLSRMALVDGISDAVALAADEARRAANYKSQALSRSWESSLATVLDELSSTL
jgi:hypothetical protein